MEFKDRKPQYPGRLSLKNVATGETATYDVSLAEGDVLNTSGFAAGTPLNKSTFDQFKDDIMTIIANNPGPQGVKGDKGDKSDIPYTPKSFLVGTDIYGQQGWYKLGTINIAQNSDYHAKIIATSTYSLASAPSGEIDIDLRRAYATWDKISIKWTSFKGAHPEYIKYSTDTSGTVTLYAYIPVQYAHYRVDIIGESNRNSDNFLFAPSVSYGGVYTTRYSTAEPNGTALSASPSSSSIEVSYFSGGHKYNEKSYTGQLTASWDYFTVGERVFNILKITGSFEADKWFRIKIGDAKFVCALPIKDSTADYAPVLICQRDATYTYIGLDTRKMQGAYILIIQ